MHTVNTLKLNKSWSIKSKSVIIKLFIIIIIMNNSSLSTSCWQLNKEE